MKDGMVNNRSCCDKCTTTSTYGFPGHRPHLCSRHKEPGTIKRPSKICVEKGCKDFTLYGLKNPLHCKAHMKPGEVNLIEGQCSKCNLIMPLVYDICEYCRPRNVKAKELKVKTILNKYNLDNNLCFYSYDSVIDSRCNLKRPDFVYDAGTHFVVVECDEHQHRSYSGADCEVVRMWSIRQALGLPVVFIRFNPDSFKVAANKSGRVSEIKREETLCKWVTNLHKVIPQSCSVVYLFYDGWHERSAKVEELPHPIFN